MKAAELETARVAITGVGAMTAAGEGAGALWQAALRGRGLAAPITHFRTDYLTTHIGVQIADLGPRADAVIPPGVQGHVDRYARLGLLAADEAWRDAGLDDPADRPDPDELVAYVGTGGGGGGHTEELIRTFQEHGPAAFAPDTVLTLPPNTLANQLAIRYNARASTATFCVACSSSSYALRAAAQEIQLRRAEVALVVGSEATLMHGPFCAFSAAGVMSRHDGDPARAMRPFDATRDGMIMGEGAAALILEPEDRAWARGARIYALYAGGGVTSDAYHPIACRSDGSGIARALLAALADAGLSPEEIGYINAHGSATQLNDASETTGIKRAFGDRAYEIPVSSTKPVTGHTIGASGAIEAVISVLALRNRLVPPTANYATPDPECDLDYVAEGPRPLRRPCVLSNSLGFGGINVMLAFVAPNA